MAAIPTERIMHIQVSQTLDGNRLTTGVYYAGSSGLTNNDCQLLSDAFELNVLPVWEAATSNALQFEMLYTYCVEPQLVRPWMSALSAQFGLIDELPNPSNVAAVLQLRQHEISGRSNGRIFLPGTTLPQVVDGLFTTGYANGLLTDLANALLAPLDNGIGGTYTLCILNRMSGGVPVVPNGYLVAEVTPSRSPGTQRRRTTEYRSFAV